MSGVTYAVGDVHGCYDTLVALLAALPLDAQRDRLWLTGDLVNRGPRSLEVLRWARQTAAAMGERFACVLGNHDLRLLAAAAGLGRVRRRDTLAPVLAAPDRDALVAWLAARPLLVRDGDRLLVHAGLRPEWSPEEAEERAREAEAALAGPRSSRLLARRSGDGAGRKLRRAGETLAVLTELRTFDRRGRPCDFSGPLAELPAGCTPWFRALGRASAGATVVFGHWAALGLYREDGALGLDTGCVWGRELTAVRLEDGTVYRQPAVEVTADGPAS